MEQQYFNLGLIVGILLNSLAWGICLWISKRLKSPIYKIREDFNYKPDKIGYCLEKRKGLLYKKYGITYETKEQAQWMLNILTKPITITTA